MQRQVLTLDNIPYLVEFRKASELNIKHVDEFIMLRKYDIVNELAYDKEILFINRTTFQKMVSRDEHNNIVIDDHELVFPYINKNFESFSSNIFDFIPNSTPQALYYRGGSIDTDLKTDYYELLIKSGSEYSRFKCDCDVIRIYRPHNRKQINSIISVSNLINDIHFHYFCQKYESQQINTGGEICFNNNIYYEYIEFFIPSIESLFGSHNVSFNEDLNLYQTQYKVWNGSYYELKTSLINKNNKAFLNNIIMPFKIERACNKGISCSECPKNFDTENSCVLQNIKNQTIKTFLTTDPESPEYKNSEFNHVNVPLVVTLTHYDSIDENSNKYLSLLGISPSSVILSSDNSFRLSSEITFDKSNRSIISVITKFIYPEIKNSEGEIMNVQEAYFYFNKITDQKAYWEFNDYEDGSFLSGLSEALIESLKFNSSGYVIEMSLDNDFDQVFYRKSVGANEIDDFAFNLNNIFYDWKEYPEIIFVRTLFIDKFLSKALSSNIMALTKEKFKYCINNTKNFRVNLKTNETDNAMKTFTFIDKINCTINKHDVAKEVKINGKTNSTIIYKTIFYKVQDVQNIRLRTNVTQNIGVNLSEYLSKVSNFKINIDGYEFVESGRNDIYVLFTIPASQLVNTMGKYDIVDAKDDTYITSGNYTII